MNLNDLSHFRALDPQDMCAHIDRLPDQLELAWQHAQTLPLPGSFKRVERIVIVSVGDGALVGDMLVALVADSCNIPIMVNRSYDLPAYVDGQSTLVIALSHSGNAEEVVAAYELADARGTQILVIAKDGGHLANAAQKGNATFWTYEDSAPARAAIGWQIGLLLALVSRLGLVRDFAGDITEAVETLRRFIPTLGIDGPVVKNPAKRLAGQMIGRTPLIYGAGVTAPVARRWKNQINANAKSLAFWEELPELNHNAISGIMHPPPLMTKIAVVFLVSRQYEHPRVALRWEYTQALYLQEGIAPDTLKMRGESALAQMMHGIQFGDYVSYYVAMAYNVDPMPTPTIDEIKEKLAASH
jgi:glucose/mannose-6-phosphate isomerase